MLSQVPGQTFTYKFDKLPYKYEPGITRSLHYEHKMAASNHEREEITPDQTTSSQIKTTSSSTPEQTSFLPIGHPCETFWSLVPSLALPVRVCPQLGIQFPPQKCNVVNLSRMTLPTSVPVPVIPVLKPGLHDSTAKSIPVSVIKRVQNPNESFFQRISD